MRQPGIADPITRFPIPPYPHESATEAQTRHLLLCDQLEAVQSDFKEARTAGLKAAERKDVERIVAEAQEGRAVKDPEKHVRAAQARIDELAARRRGLSAAVHESGNELARAIGADRDEWAADLGRREEEAAQKLHDLADKLLHVADELRVTRAGREWLGRFNAGQAIVGHVHGFPGGRLRVAHGDRGALRGEHDVADLLQLVKKAATPPEPPPAPRPLVAARESSRR